MVAFSVQEYIKEIMFSSIIIISQYTIDTKIDKLRSSSRHILFRKQGKYHMSQLRVETGYLCRYSLF